LATWALLLLVAIVVTGGAVRLTGSGLGCSDWPTCEQDRVVPAWSFHPWVEFGNRLITGAVSAGVIAAVAGALLRVPRRRDLLWLALGLVAGVVAQILLGALLVWSHLDPGFTAGHYLLSAVLVANAAVLRVRARPEAEPWAEQAGWPARRLAFGAVAACAAVLVAGTVVTGAGPHGGDDRAARLNLEIAAVTKVHSLLAWTLCAVLVALALAARRCGDGRLLSRVEFVLALVVAQGALGYLQFAMDIPAGLVAIHLGVAMVVWAALVDLATRLHEGGRAGLRRAAGESRPAGEPVLSAR
jgi:cytochrome c oxidase assembly protein subunit 15